MAAVASAEAAASELKAVEALLADARKEIAEQRAVLEVQAKIISLLWDSRRSAAAPIDLDDIVADYTSLRPHAAAEAGADKMIFSSD